MFNRHVIYFIYMSCLRGIYRLCVISICIFIHTCHLPCSTGPLTPPDLTWWTLQTASRPTPDKVAQPPDLTRWPTTLADWPHTDLQAWPTRTTTFPPGQINWQNKSREEGVELTTSPTGVLQSSSRPPS
jgi:hypothetical protein